MLPMQSIAYLPKATAVRTPRKQANHGLPPGRAQCDDDSVSSTGKGIHEHQGIRFSFTLSNKDT